MLDRLELNKIISVGNMDYSIETIYYDFNKWFIRPDAAKELDKLVRVMKENPVTVELGSHTDSRGSNEYNMDLSQKRAESAVRYIVLQGIATSRISAKGYGESILTNRCSDGVPCTADEHQANRRTEFKITGFSKSADVSDYDLTKFKSGEEIPVYLLDHDFFIDCLQDRRLKKTSNTSEIITPSPTENIDQPAVTAPVKVTKPVKEVNPVIEPKPVGTEKPKVVEKQAAIEKQVTPVKEVKQVEPDVNTKPVKETPVSNPSSVTYRVQLFALIREKSLVDPEFEDLQDVQMYREDGMFKYTTGVFKTHTEALKYRDTMVQAGFYDAFVVTFANGKRIYISPSF